MNPLKTGEEHSLLLTFAICLKARAGSQRRSPGKRNFGAGRERTRQNWCSRRAAQNALELAAQFAGERDCNAVTSVFQRVAGGWMV